MCEKAALSDRQLIRPGCSQEESGNVVDLVLCTLEKLAAKWVFFSKAVGEEGGAVTQLKEKFRK